MAFEATLRAKDFVVKVRLPRQSDLSWLTEFLYPQFLLDDEATADCVISMVADRQRFDELHNLGPISGKEHLPCFLLDGHTEAFPQWNSRSGYTAVYEHQMDALYLVAEDGDRIEIVAKTLRPWLRVRLLRVIRELMMAHLRLGGWFILHAAAGMVDGGAFAIAGPKNSGKTSLLIRLIREMSAQPVTYDRLAILPTPSEVSCLGVPTTVSVKAGTAAMNADLFKFLDPNPMRAVLTEQEQEQEQEEQSGNGSQEPSEERLLMNPRQFCHLFDVAPAGATALSTIIFPQLDKEAPESRLNPLTPSVARDRLKTALFGFNYEPPHLSLFARKYNDPGYGPERLNAQIESLVNCIASYDYIIASGRSDEIRLDPTLLRALDS